MRARNEDSFGLDPERGLAVVADGRGGHPAGDVASRLATERALEILGRERRAASPRDPLRAMAAAMRDAILEAHERVRSQAERGPGLEGMGTTLTALALDARAGLWVVGHVGDSRAYLLRGGALARLTRDDTWIQERVDAGELTPEEARGHPHAHILLQCLGLDETPVPQLVHGRIEPHDAFLLCTDGLTGMLDDAALEEVLASAPLDREGPEPALRALLDAAIAAGGHDNVTAVLVLA
ncbi:MAG TPA: protein phosphatase 2C domain-containing protein [Longimicrobiales bacterium]|nr:protein phosphatase 2C domain-containing protein [Longimicrobiales bacterium]